MDNARKLLREARDAIRKHGLHGKEGFLTADILLARIDAHLSLPSQTQETPAPQTSLVSALALEEQRLYREGKIAGEPAYEWPSAPQRGGEVI